MDEARTVRVSKFLSKHLRHAPQEIGITLAEGGWVEVDDLLAACGRRGMSLSRAELEHVVASNDKQRFSFDETGARIRANQGHSVDVDLRLEAVTPPDELFHGTGHQTADAIAREGLRAMRRHHVHLSRDVETARRVGARHGRPVIFAVDSKAMAEAGHLFYVSDNGVWLTDAVPPTFLRRT
ncbi:MAG TPA: RNA 2'-phosphotransferase [Armatimonadaceae bacterium]|nr:RNA 2'-phosphotransferase [Armatimonadaceae bacterium]